MSRAGLVLVPFLAVLLSSCAGDLDSTYGTSEREVASVNGVAVMRAACARLGLVRHAWMLSERLNNAEVGTLVHVRTEAGVPSAAVQTWLWDWLAEEPGRQVVLVLRDGNIAPWVCTRWAIQARAEADRVGSPADLSLHALATRLDERALREAEPVAHTRSDAEPVDPHAEDILPSWVMLDPGPAVRPQRLAGLGLVTVPATLTIGAVPTGDQLESLVVAHGPGPRQATLVGAIPVGDSRLVIIANATGIVDGALPDPAARALLAGVLDEVQRYATAESAPAGVAWVSRLAINRGDESNLDMLRLLFATPPISYVAWHLIAVLLVFLLWRNRWLGRREAPPRDDKQRFILHIRALARLLRSGGHAHATAAEIARLRRLPTSPPPGNAAVQCAWLDASASRPDKDHR